MPSFTIDAPNGKSYTIDGENAQGALAALQQHLGDRGPHPLQEPEAADHGLSERQKLSPIEKAVSPITSYPATYDRMNKDAREQVARGVEQLSLPEKDSAENPATGSEFDAVAPHGLSNVARGAANIVSGGLGYVASPINAAYRSIAGQPIEDTTGIPREYTEFAGQLATPGIGIAGAPSKAAPVVKAVERAAPSIQELKAAAKAGYDSPELVGLEVKPAAMSDYATATKVKLDESGLSDVNAPKVHAILGKIEQIPESPSAIMTGRNIHSIRQALGHAAASTDPQERLAASKAIDALDEHIPKIEAKDVLAGSPQAAGEALDTANANYSAAKQSEKIDNKTVQAELRAAAANSGMNVANTVRQRMADVVLKPAERRGLLPEEVQAAQDIAEGTPGQNALRRAGNILGGGGGLGMLHASSVGAGAGAFVAGPVGAAIGAALPAIAGHTLKAIANKMTLTQAAKLSEMIRSRAPLASSMDKFEVSAGALSKSRDPKAISSAVLAARNLSNNLRASGFNVSPSDLLSGIQGPAPAGADDKQQ